MKERGSGKQTNQEVFARYFPDGTITDCILTEIPETALEFFEMRSQMFILPENYKPGNFSRFMKISNTVGEITYAAIETKTYENGETEELTHLLDQNKDGKEVGRGEIAKYLKGAYPKTEISYLKDKPVVSTTLTRDEFQGNGYGIRRVRMMNAISQMLYSLPLYSSGSPSEPQKRIWERLVKSNEAETYVDILRRRQVLRYRFVY